MEWSPINLEWVRTFAVAADTENFRETARRRFINQTSVSHQIWQLEAEIGAALFVREGRRVRLTEAGRVFRQHADRLLGMAEQSIWQAQHAGRSAESVIRIEACPYTAEVVLPWLCQQVLQARADTDLQLAVHPSSMVLGHVVSGIADGGLLRTLPSTPGLEAVRVLTDPLVLVMQPDGRDMDHAVPLWDEVLKHERLLMPSDANYAPLVGRRLRDLGITPETMAIESPAVTKKLVEAGVGVAIMPELAVARERIEGRLLTLCPSWLEDVGDQLYWIWAKDSVVPQMVGVITRIFQRRFASTFLAPM